MKNVRHLWIGLIAGTLLTGLFFNSLVINIEKPVGGDNLDAFHVYFILKHYVTVFSSSDWQSLPTLPMFYGFKNSLFFTDHHLLPGLATVALYPFIRDVVTIINLLMLVTIFAVFFSMFLLAWHFTRNTLASILAAVIYTFNPYLTNHIPNYLLLFSVQWIPLTFLFFEKALKSSKSSHQFLFFLFLIFQLLGSSLYYSAFLSIILPIYMIVRMIQQRVSIRIWFTRGAVVGVLLLALVAAVIGSFYLNVFSSQSINRPLDITEYFYSDWLASWLFTGNQVRLYSGLRDKAIQVAPRFFPVGGNSEQSLFLGIVPTLILVSSFWLVNKQKSRQLWRIWVVLLGVSLVLSFGPRIHLTDRMSMPGPYLLLYNIHPLFHFTRVAARFAVFVAFFLALIAGLTFQQAGRRFKPATIRWIGLLLLGAVLAEYWNRPIQFIRFDQATREFYRTLNQQGHIRIILNLPIANRFPNTQPQARTETRDAWYLLFAATLHSKTLFNGYSSFIPNSIEQRAAIISLNFPSSVQLSLLKLWRVDGIVLHRGEYPKPQEYQLVKKALIALNVSVITETDDLSLFDLTRWKPAQ